MGVRLGVVKQSFFGLPGQYGRRVTKANCTRRIALGICNKFKAMLNEASPKEDYTVAWKIAHHVISAADKFSCHF